MPMFKRLFLSTVLLALAGSAALAGWNLKQKDTGQTVYESDTGIEWPVNRVILGVDIASIETAATAMLISPITGTISRVVAVVNNGINSTNNIMLSVLARVTQGALLHVSPALTIRPNTVSWSNFTSTPVTNNVVGKDSVITVNTDGGGANANNARIMVIIDAINGSTR